MSTPYTLAEGFRILVQRKKHPPKNKGTTDVVDILGIVSNISTSSSAALSLAPVPSSRRRNFPHSQIWLIDDSQVSAKRISSSEESLQLLISASFVLYGSSEVARVDQEQIKAGDILRFNRVALKDSGGTLQFRFSSHDIEPGVNWFRLGHIDGRGSFIENYFDDHCSASRIPENMKTSKERMAELVNWYNNNHHQIPLQLSTSNTLPTLKRQLSEIQFTAGVLSNVKVKVTQVHSEPAAVVNTNYKSSGRNKKRSRTLPPVAFAIFTDDSGVLMPFIDISGRFLTNLRSAKNDNDNTTLIMTNLYTEYQSNLRALETSTKEIILVPTETTSGILVSDENNSDRTNTETRGFPDFEAMQTQETTHVRGREITIISRMIDLLVNGISLKKSQSAFSTSSVYLETILENGGRCFRSANIHLDGNNCSGQVSNNTSFVASPDVLKILCGSLDINELFNDERLCAHSMGFIRSLIQEDVVLKWTLSEDDEEKVTIVKAVVYHIPE